MSLQLQQESASICPNGMELGRNNLSFHCDGINLISPCMSCRKLCFIFILSPRSPHVSSLCLSLSLFLSVFVSPSQSLTVSLSLSVSRSLNLSPSLSISLLYRLLSWRLQPYHMFFLCISPTPVAMCLVAFLFSSRLPLARAAQRFMIGRSLEWAGVEEGGAAPKTGVDIGEGLQTWQRHTHTWQHRAPENSLNDLFIFCNYLYSARPSTPFVFFFLFFCTGRGSPGQRLAQDRRCVLSPHFFLRLALTFLEREKCSFSSPLRLLCVLASRD